MEPPTSWMATMRAPLAWNTRAAALPTLPKPWMATRAPSIFIPRWRIASRATTKQPRPVASRRPRLPPMLTGLPVTTPVCVPPWLME